MPKKIIFALLMLSLSFSIVFGLTTVISENFAGFTVSNGSTDVSASLNTYLQTPGWTGSKIYQNAGEAKLGNSSTMGYIVTPALNISGSGGNATLSFDVRYFGTDIGKFMQVLLATDGVTFVQIGTDISIPAVMTTINLPITGGTANSKLKIAARDNPANRFYLDNVTVTQQAAIDLPTVTTNDITGITNTTATCGGNVTSENGSAVTQRGVCWNTSSTPLITNFHTSDGTGSGAFVSAITGLNPATLYYVCAYATNGVGTAYGTEVNFTTSGGAPPAAPTATFATGITSNSFVANWNPVTTATSYRLDVSANNGFTSFLTAYNNLTVNSTSQVVSGLSINSTYYYRVRAVNATGSSANSNPIIVTTTASDPFDGYYTPVTGLTGNALKTGLHDLIDTNTNTSYDGTKLQIFQNYDNQNGVVRCVYTGQDYTVSNTYDGASDPNTEHTFAQSWFGTSEASIKKADGHHLYPTNSNVNSSRGNYPFDEVTSITTTFPSYNGYQSYKGTNVTGHIVFEPADQHKGDLARALLYFAVRYNMSLSIDGVDMLPTLIVWNTTDPVDARELARNTAINNYQHNRNPFVDHPEYVTYIWGGSAPNTTLSFSPASAIVDESAGTVTLTVAISNPGSTATTAQIQLTDGSASDVNNYTTTAITFPAGSSVSQTVTIHIADDTLIEGTENLVFSLTNISGGTSAGLGNYGSFNLTILDNDIPVVTALPASDITPESFTANWQAANGITNYEFDLSIIDDFSTFVGSYSALAVTGTSLNVRGLSANTTYYYRVRASFNETPGTNSNIITADTLPLPVTGDLFISEYLEGSSNNKAIEIFNPNAVAVDLSQYALKLAPNGGAYSTTLNLTGTLQPNDVFVVANSGAVASILNVSDITSTVTYFNGNDAVGLFRNDVLIDCIGIQGNDPGTTSGWSVAGTANATKDHTLVRKPTILQGNTDWNTSAGTNEVNSEWIVYPNDTFTYLGSHTTGIVTLNPPIVTISQAANQITLSWQPVANALSYRIESASTPDSTYTDITSSGVLNTGTIPIIWQSGSTNSMYFYHVIASSVSN